MLKRLLKPSKRSRSADHRIARATSAWCEPLEARRMFSTIVWTNRGITSGPNSDNVNSVFGPVYAGQVRPLIDAVLANWARVISNFNYPGGGNTYNMTISFAASGTSLGANAGPASYASDGKPLTGNMTIGRGGDTSNPPDGIGDGGGWFVDTNPYDNSEFKSSTSNGFAGYTTDATSPAFNLADMYQVVMHEMGHAMGLLPTAQIQAKSTITSTTDTLNAPASSPVSKFWRFDGPSIKTLETSYDSGGQGGNQYNANGSQHHADAGALAIVNGVTYLGSDDLMTAYYSASQRRLISDTDALMLKDAYGYTIQLPSVFGTYYDTLDADGTLRITTPGNGNDTIAIDQSGSNVIVNLNLGTPVAGADVTNSIASLFAGASVQRIVINAGDGNDTIRLENTGGKPVTVNGGNGDDTINLEQTYRNLDQFGAGAVVVSGGSGNDTVNIYDNNNARADKYYVSSGGISRDSWSGLAYGAGVDSVSLTTGTANNAVAITSTQSGQAFVLNSAAGADTVTIGGTGTTQSILGNVEIHNSPNFTTLTIDDTNDFGSRDIVIDNSGSFGVLTGITGPTGGAISWINGDISAISVVTSQFGGGTIAVRAVSKPITIKNLTVGNQGANYAVTLGNGANGMQSLTAAVTLIAAYGQNSSLTLNNTADTVGRATSVTRNSVNGDYLISGLAPVLITWRDFGSMDIEQGGGADTLAIGGGTMGNYLPLIVNGNGGNDTYTLTAFDNWAEGLGGTDTWPVTIDGGGGYNILSVVDTSRGNTSYQFYPDRFYSFDPVGFGQGSDFHYDGMSAIGVSCSNGNNSLLVYGVSSDIDPGNQLTFALSGGNDAVAVYPHDAQGNLTINGNIGIVAGAGTDSIVIDDSASSNPIAYALSNPFGSGTQNVYGLGTRGLGYTSDFESATIKGGGGNDTFAINQYSSGVGLTLFGGGGDDTLNFGNNNLAAYVPSISSFLFDGQGGYNTFNLLSVNDGTGDYARNLGAVSYFGTSGYGITLSEANTQLMQIYPSSNAPNVSMVGVASGTTTAVHFNTPVNLGLMKFGVGSKKVTGIQGAVIFDGGANGSSISVIDSLETVGRTVHLTQNSLGAFPGDDLFPVGGSLTFTNIKAGGANPGLNLFLGTGADTLYAQPSATGTISISGGNPTSPPGDVLNLALAAAQNYAINGTAASGSVTSSNLKTLSYSGFETGPNVDAVAPAVVAADINLDGIPGFARGGEALDSVNRQSLDVQFSENVAGLISATWLELTNLTTSSTIPTGNIAVEYDSGSNTAHFTFPGYSNGILPDGNYHGRILAGLPDAFGNGLPADATFDFFFLNADANHDASVDTIDFNILATNFSQLGTFSQGDFNYDGSVNTIDFNILASQFSEALAPGGAAASASPSNATRPGVPMSASLFGNVSILACDDLKLSSIIDAQLAASSSSQL